MKIKTPQINFREPNIERFIEIMLSAKFLGLSFDFTIVNLPSLYFTIPEYREILTPIILTKNKEECDYFCEYIYSGYKEFKNKYLEDPKEILKRVSTISLYDYETLNLSSIQLLKTAITKLNLTPDRIQSCVNLSAVIACVEGSAEIKVEHIAEAIQYSTNINN